MINHLTNKDTSYLIKNMFEEIKFQYSVTSIPYNSEIIFFWSNGIMAITHWSNRGTADG